MNKYDKAAMLIGKYGTEAECDAIVQYLKFISAMEEEGVETKEDKAAVENSLERISDELNHLLGDTLDAMRLAGLKISPDDIEKIFEGLEELVDYGSVINNDDDTPLNRLEIYRQQKALTADGNDGPKSKVGEYIVKAEILETESKDDGKINL